MQNVEYDRISQTCCPSATCSVLRSCGGPSYQLHSASGNCGAAATITAIMLLDRNIYHHSGQDYTPFFWTRVYMYICTVILDRETTKSLLLAVAWTFSTCSGILKARHAPCMHISYTSDCTHMLCMHTSCRVYSCSLSLATQWQPEQNHQGL